MPIDHVHDHDHALLIIRMVGEIADEDLIAYAREVIADSSIRPEADDYVDLSRVTAMTVTGEGVRRFGEMLREGGRAGNPGRMAIFAPSDMAFGMARMFELSRGEGPIEVRVFRDEQQARRWIGLPPA